MDGQIGASKRSPARTGKSAVGKKTVRGREIWHVNSDGRHRDLATNRGSAKAMDQAMKVFGPALRRLADR